MMPETPAIREGFRTEHRYVISPLVYEQFLRTFGDTNRLHTEDDFARSRGFPARVMHGAILNGFISHFVGVHFPGDGAVLQTLNTQFKSPCHLGDEISIAATVAQVSEAVGVVTLEMVLTNLTRGRVAAKVKAQVGIP